MGLFENYVFELRNGTAEAHSRKLPFSADVEHTSFGWLVGLQNMPPPPAFREDIGKIFGRKTFGDDIPRLVLLDDDLEIRRAGLYEKELPESGSIGTARRLKVAWDGYWLYAAELGNHQIFALDKDFELQATYRDPELFLEEGINAVDKKDVEETEQRYRDQVERQGKDLVPPRRARREESDDPAASASVFNYQAVILDITWDHGDNRLLLLIAAGITENSQTLDILDPTTGDVRRVSLRFPAGSETTTFSQVIAGHDYLWFRSLSGEHPPYRLDRTQLFEKGERLVVPEFSLFEDVAESK